MPLDEPPPFDLDAAIAGLAMYANPMPGSLSAKLNIIWYYAVQLILRSEREHDQVIGRAWGRHRKKATDTDSILVRAEAAEQNGLLKERHSGLASAYFSVLGELRLIQQRILNVQTDQDWTASATESLNSVRSICHPNHLKIEGYRNEVVPRFFTLQLHCLHLGSRLANPSAGPSNPEVKMRRAASGGRRSNHGEELLKADVVAYLAKQPAKARYDSVAAFFDAHFEGLAKVLENYRKRNGERWEGEPLTYGQTLTPECRAAIRMREARQSR